jgi:hypothetical protein
MELTIEYIPTDADLSQHTVKGRGYAAYPSHFLAVGPGALLHGNSIIAIKKGTDDVAGGYKTWRRWRIWKVPAGDGIPSSGAKLESAWADDNLSKTPNWMDIPGVIHAEGLAGLPAERRLLEFVVAVEGHPAIGAVYFFVVLNVGAGQYRVQMSDGKSMPFAHWPKISATTAPWTVASGCKIVVDSRPLPMP